MLKLLGSFLPVALSATKDAKNYIQRSKTQLKVYKLAESLFIHLDTPEEQERVANFAITAINRGNGKMTKAEWTKLGGSNYLGVIGGGKR
jgi:hypothetical protein